MVSRMLRELYLKSESVHYCPQQSEKSSCGSRIKSLNQHSINALWVVDFNFLPWWACFTYCHQTVISSFSRVWLCNPMDCSTLGFPVLHYFLELAETHVHQVGNAMQPSHPLSSPSPPAFNLSQHQGLLQWVNSSHQVAKVLELQHQFFQ